MDRWPHRLLLLPILVLLGRPGYVSTNVTCVVPSKQSYKSSLISTGDVVWTCSKPQTSMFNNGLRMISSNCTDPATLESGLSCVAATSDICPAAEPVIPAYSSILGAFYDPLNAYVYYVVCNGKGWWQSGAKGQMSQCLNGTWSTITDKCIEPSGTAGNASTTAQPVTTASSTAARDCAEIAMMGHSISGIYSIIPSGNSSDSDMKVMCTLSSDPGDSGWTQVLYLSLPTIIPIVINAGDVMGTPGSGTFYFIGFNALTSLNWNITTLQNTSRPLVFLVELVKADGTTLYATYNAVVIARDNYYTLQNVGDYHGNAGDMLRHSKLHGIVGSSSLLWSCDSPQTCVTLWFSGITWGSLSFVQVTISVRPSTYDAIYACPAVMSFDPTWPSTTVIQMTASRSVGAIVSYTCTDGLIEGNATVGYSTTGSAKCLPKTLTWSMIPVLPCNLVCPVGYTMINDTCVYASSQVPELGLVSASLECHQSNSSLINVTSVDQLSVATPGTFYYTAHIYTSSAGFVSQPPAFTCAVGETCAGGLGLECLAMTVSGNQIVARSQNCYRNDTFALCAVPDYCPNNFTAYRGLCYKVVSQYNPIYSFSSALSYCNSLGAALAYPETLDVIDFLVELVRQSVTSLTGEVYVLTGYNTRLDPTMGGIYNPSPEVIDIPLEVSGYADRILAINPLNYTVYSDNMTSSLPVNYAVCQMYGPKDCWTDPPEPTLNMTRKWNTSRSLFVSATWSLPVREFHWGSTPPERARSVTRPPGVIRYRLINQAVCDC
ncbi:uncharacterized protein [Cherax quadricarinatus]|uniref:uncharacterized protein n=1 Tax=Cherax quadricarinatus TaxID=27406 RepID=UPI00387EC0C0